MKLLETLTDHSRDRQRELGSHSGAWLRVRLAVLIARFTNLRLVAITG
ncbi:hypothetical protein JQ543_05805 [Bradyrhizobium diazoefficiens]|nr:hypothetical protein [Bradyrhizobium diazoefficiens]MBR0847255.1 hypothetical protein [Bradyrhizobium diazoefficiens]